MVRHENIVEFLGFAQNPTYSVYVMGKLHFVWPFNFCFNSFLTLAELAETSLHDYVHDKTKPLDYNIIKRWATHIANGNEFTRLIVNLSISLKGVYYLHFEAMKPKHLVHCDLKPTNGNGACKR